MGYDTAAQVASARALWRLVDRANMFVKILAAVQGLPAISSCLSEGNQHQVPQIFSLSRYDAVMAAFLNGMEAPATPAATCARFGRSRRSSSLESIGRSTPGWRRWARPRRSRCAAGRPAVDLLVGAGIAAAVPIALSGLNDWSDTYGAETRLGFAHAAGNVVALAASWNSSVPPAVVAMPARVWWIGSGKNAHEFRSQRQGDSPG